MDRRIFLSGLALAATWGPAARAAEPIPVMAYRDPGCGCCEGWAAILNASGFAVTIVDDPDRASRLASLGLPAVYASCHTALVDGYALEGHVPAKEIRRLLAERPGHVVGLAVPGMPVGSPGMGAPEGGDPYDVLLIGRDGSATVFARYPS